MCDGIAYRHRRLAHARLSSQISRDPRITHGPPRRTLHLILYVSACLCGFLGPRPAPFGQCSTWNIFPNIATHFAEPAFHTPSFRSLPPLRSSRSPTSPPSRNLRIDHVFAAAIPSSSASGTGPRPQTSSKLTFPHPTVTMGNHGGEQAVAAGLTFVAARA